MDTDKLNRLIDECAQDESIQLQSKRFIVRLDKILKHKIPNLELPPLQVEPSKNEETHYLEISWFNHADKKSLTFGFDPTTKETSVHGFFRAQYFDYIDLYSLTDQEILEHICKFFKGTQWEF